MAVDSGAIERATVLGVPVPHGVFGKTQHDCFGSHKLHLFHLSTKIHCTEITCSKHCGHIPEQTR